MVKDGDISGFADKLDVLMGDELLRASFSKQAGQGIERFQKEKILEQWKALFDLMLM